MKLFCTCFCLVAVASAVAPPRIELELAQTADKLSTPIYRAHNDKKLQTDGSQVGSRQDWSQQCAAGKSTTTATCPFPVAKAFDHHDEDISSEIQTRVYLVDVDGHSCGTDAYDCGCDSDTDSQCKVSTVNFDRRSTYLFKYDVTDSSGNHAEQVVFSLVLNDLVKPTLTMCGDAAEVWQAAKDTFLCEGTLATDDDELDTQAVLAKQIRYDIIKENEASGTQTYLCQNADYSDYKAYMQDSKGTTPCAKSELSTTRVGRYIVIFKVCDLAGVYGANSESNCVEQRKAILIKDSLPPVIDITGDEPAYQECHNKASKGYRDEGATYKDELDTEKLHLDISGACEGEEGEEAGCTRTSSNVNSAQVGDYKVEYDSWDMHGNKAAQAKRIVWVSDNVAPTATLHGDRVISHYVRKDHGEQSCTPNCAVDDAGATCKDDCDTGITVDATKTWKDGIALDDQKLGDYVRIYTCTDASDHTHSVTRTFTVIDDSRPTITVQPASCGEETTDTCSTDGTKIVLEASNTLGFEDFGAECHDYVDGDISHAVQVGGDIVNRRIPGTYTITYACMDRSGNKAQSGSQRTVIVQDTKCPNVQRTGDGQVRIEAGFEYNDEGATASDTLDGDITSKIFTDGDQVNTRNAFYRSRSCKEIKQEYPGASTGEYYITVRAGDRWKRQLVFCGMEDSWQGRTFYKCDGCKRVVPYGADQGSCEDLGLKMINWASHSAETKEMLKKRFSGVTHNDKASTNMYWCGFNTEPVSDAVANYVSHKQISHAEAGTYVIKYHVFDNAGNKECDDVSRTVVVEDTLPPVITLHLSNRLIHTGSSQVAGNPAADKAKNPNLADGFEPEQTAWAARDSAGRWQGRRLKEVSTQSGAAWVAGVALMGLALFALRPKASSVVEV